MIERLKEAVLKRDERMVWQIAADSWDDATERPANAWPHIIDVLAVADDDSIAAIATCILEHVLEHDFTYFDRVEQEIAAGNAAVLRAFFLCSKFGQSKLPENERRWDKLVASSRRITPAAPAARRQ
jgi:hypothetical protein